MPIYRFLKKLSIAKIVNFFILRVSYYMSAIFKKPMVFGMPVKIAVEPTNLCNLKCPECPTGINGLTRKKGNMDLILLKKITEQMNKELISMIFYFQGEPFLSKNLFEMIKIATKQNIYTYCSTNGHFFNPETVENIIKSGLDELIISLDGVNQKVYEHYRRGGSLNTVLQGTRELIKKKEELKSALPYTKFQFLVVKPNEHQINDAKILAKQIAVNTIVFKTAQIYDFEQGNPLIPANEKYSRYKKVKNGKYRLKKKLNNRCWRLWSNPVITVEGDVLPCCFDKDAKYAMGNMNEQSFSEIWKGEKYQKFRNKLLTNRKSIDICRNCTE